MIRRLYVKPGSGVHMLQLRIVEVVSRASDHDSVSSYAVIGENSAVAENPIASLQ